MTLIEIEEMTIPALTAAMERGELTSVVLVQVYLDRIARYDKSGPALNAILEINPDALFIAEALDSERKQGGVRGPLHGIPILLKDNIDTGDRMHTSAGSLALADSYAPRDAFLVRRLRKAGAVILGKANMTEFANYMADAMPSGYSSRGGQVKNPYNPEWDPSGSSSGSAVAAAANLCAAAVGTETDGSIVSPARANGVVGLKPTVGLVSRSGIVPISHTQDTAGPLARTVTDAAVLLGAMTGVDRNDPATWRSRWSALADYTPFLQREGLRGARLGLCTADRESLHAEDRERLDGIAAVLRGEGAEVTAVDRIFDADEHALVLRHEFKTGLNYYLHALGPGVAVRNLADVITFNKAHSETALRYGQGVLERCEATSGTLTESRYLADLLRHLREIRGGIDRILGEQGLEALVFLKGTSIAAVAGYPAVIVPAGFADDGKPYGLTFIGPAFSEPALIKLAYAFEQAAGRRKTPKIN